MYFLCEKLMVYIKKGFYLYLNSIDSDSKITIFCYLDFC
jgi:hypothetical protein